MEIVRGGAENQLRRIFDNLEIILDESGTTLDRIIQKNLYLTDFDYFEAFNRVSIEYIGERKPTRATVTGFGAP